MPLWSQGAEDQESRTAQGPSRTAQGQAEPPKAKAAEKTVAKPPVEAATEKELSSADMQKRREVSARLLMRFGEVVSVMMRAQQFRELPP